ncbi:MAG TPA: diphthine--ammonia ligase [Nitrosopumilaceae archaeon]|nr:diphthine--ammonia ligase [Nitrosopumilaceae archaeon]
MNLVSLFSGGKDSSYSIYKAKQEGHQIRCLVTILPLSDESKLLHFPNIEITKLQSKSMGIPQLFIKSESNETAIEEAWLEKVLQKAKSEYEIDGLLHGGILSEFQKNIFEKICSNLNLKLISPLWKKDHSTYMKELIHDNFHFIISSVSAGGLDETWLGKEITSQNLEKLEQLSKKYGFNVNFEGGEAETLVIDCPLFSKPLKILNSRKSWDGVRGRFEILDAELDHRVR